MLKIHKGRTDWNFPSEPRGWTGGRWMVNNQSSGYHGILKQWWDDTAAANQKWLLVSENNEVKKEFQEAYPEITFQTVDYYDNMGEKVDLPLNICDFWNINEVYDTVVCQATLEHVYDPVASMKNMSAALVPGGTVLIHTHVPGMKYHPHPRDYLRYYPDWFVDIAPRVGLELLDLVENGVHIFARYRKCK